MRTKDATRPGRVSAELVRDLWLPLPLAALAVVESALAGGDRVVLRCVLAGATVLGLVARRHQPGLSAAWVATGLAAESVVTESPDEAGVLLAIIVSAFSVAVTPNRRETVLGLGMLALAITVSISLDPSDSASNIPPTLVLFLGLPAGLGLVFGRRGRALARMAEENAELQEEARMAVSRERQRLSHELHDVVSHAVTLIAVSAEAGATQVRSDPDAAERAFTAIADTSRDALAELQVLLALLREDAADAPAPGLDHLDVLVAGVRASGTRVDLERSGERGPIDATVDRVGYRVVQEALTNALRHSRAPELDVQVSEEPSRVSLRVTSRGTPHRSTYGGTGSGLAGLRERVEALGGQLTAGRDDEGAFVVSALLPREAT
jgi:signal transduction histidine kinase